MKNLRSLVLALAVFGPLSVIYADSVTFTDNFNGSALNSALWSGVAPYSDSGVTVTGGNLVLSNGGRVATKSGFQDPVDVVFSFQFTGNLFDSFKVNLRTDGTSTNASGVFDNGIFASFRMRSDPSDPAGTIGNVSLYDQNNPANYFATLGTGTFSITQNQPVVVRFLDTGTTVSLFINDLSTPFLTAASTNSYGDLLGFDNREGAGNGSYISAGTQVKIDFVSVTSAVPDGGSTALYLGLVLAVCGLVKSRFKSGTEPSRLSP